MGITTFRARILALAPGFLNSGTGERLLYTFGLATDAVTEIALQGTRAHIPIMINPETREVLGVPPADCLAEIGIDRSILRGLTESDQSYAVRLQHAYEAWQRAGTARGMLSQILGYMLDLTPRVCLVSSRFDPAVVDGRGKRARLSSQWDDYPAGRSLNAEPVHTYDDATYTSIDPLVPTGDGNFDWDGGSLITGSLGFWSAIFVIESVGANAWCQPAQAWGFGSVYTPAGSGYYSTVSGTAYALAGSYAGSSQAWGEGSTYAAAASGYYSTVRGGAYVLAGEYGGVSQAWGVDITTDIGQSFQIILRQFKPASAWIRALCVSFDAAQFDPTQPPGAGLNPDGYWGQFSRMAASTYAYDEARLTTAVYGGEVT